METFLVFSVLFLLAVVLVALLMSITHGSRLRALEKTLAKAHERLAALEVGKPVETVAKETPACRARARNTSNAAAAS